MDYKVVKECRVCGSSHLKKYLDLGEHELANALLSSSESKPNKYPVQVLFCEACSLSQLSIVVSPEILYKDYPYHSSVSNTFAEHCAEMARSSHKLFTSINKPLVIDIASNDGCLLEQFEKAGFYVMGVEPSENLAKKAEEKGISTINDFWGESAADRITSCDLFTATNVLAHVDDVQGFIKLCASKLRAYTSGFMIVEVPYMKNLIMNNQFDTIYHEHLSYFLLKPLNYLFNSCGMKIFKVEEVPIHGGSLRIYASGYDRPDDGSVERMLHEESNLGLHEYRIYQAYSDRVTHIKDRLRAVLNYCNEDGGKVAGFGASAKGISLMNYCGITNTDISYIADDTPDKQGKFTPGSNIPITSRDHFDTNHPDYMLILSWNFANEMKEKTKGVGAKYIIPIPAVRVE